MKTITRYNVVFFLFVMLTGATGQAADQPAPADTAAVVNGKAITQNALTFETQRFLEQMARQGQVPGEDMMPQVRKDVLSRMIEGELL